MRLLLRAAVLCALAGPVAAEPLPFGPGEQIVMKITYAHLLAGRARVGVAAAEQDGRQVLRFTEQADSMGFFAWLFHFRVHDRTEAIWDPASGCSLRIEKKLREGHARRDQVVVFDPAGGAEVADPKIAATHFDTVPCALDILSALFVARVRGVDEKDGLELPVFDNGRRFVLAARILGREVLDLPPPLGRRVPTIIVEPRLAEGTGLFVKEKGGRLRVWLTDDARRIPVRMRSKVAIGSVAADVESYVPPTP